MSQDNSLWRLATEICAATNQLGNVELIIKNLHAELTHLGWTPPPRVFLEGDDIPSYLPVINNHGEVRDDYQDWDAADEETYTANYDVVEMNIDYDAAVEREKVRRAASSPRAEVS